MCTKENWFLYKYALFRAKFTMVGTLTAINAAVRSLFRNQISNNCNYISSDEQSFHHSSVCTLFVDQFSSTICILLRSACIAKFRYPSVLIRTILVVLTHGQFCTRVNISTTCQFIIKHDVSLYIYRVCQKIPVYFEALYLLQFWK